MIGAPGALAICQLAYKVENLEAAALAHHRQFGSGPFFVLRHVKLASPHHRRAAQPFDHSSAYGQWGAVMVELVVQHNAAPSALHDMFPHGSGAEGLLSMSGERSPYPGKLGVIEAGAHADILVWEGDPAKSLDFLGDPATNLKLVMKGGRVFRQTL